PFFYIALELLEGRTLEEEVQERGRLTEGYAFWLAEQVVAALAAVEEHRVVHGDLKPSNVFITNSGVVKVMDFGHSSLLEFENLTQAGAFIGTAPFAAPEQFVDSSQLDARVDQYALGALLYHALTGSVPFPQATSMAALAEAHQQSQPVPPRLRNPQLSYFSQAFIKRLMSKRKEDRFPSLREVGMVLKTRESSTFFFKHLPHQHLRRDSAAFWAPAVFPRFPSLRCPAHPKPALTVLVEQELSRMGASGMGRAIAVRAERGSGVSRALYEALHPRTDVQVARVRPYFPGEYPLAPLYRLFTGLFPHHRHPDFSWEEQFRFITGTTPDQWATLRIFLKDPKAYTANFAEDRDPRLAQDAATVLGAMAADLPLVCFWDRCESYQPRLTAILMKLVPKLEGQPVLTCCAGPTADGAKVAGQAEYGALVRALKRQSQRFTEHVQPPPDTAYLQKLLAYSFADPEEIKFLLRKSLNHDFRSYHWFFSWVGYWKEALHVRKVGLGRSLTPAELQALGPDPLTEGGGPDALCAARMKFLPRAHQRALTVMAEEGELFELPRPDGFREALNPLERHRIFLDLDRRWYVTIYRNHGAFRNPELANWIRRNPVPR
ncbi:MAG TPA: serine/threonine-protein kinase, partial [bacterium]|nr:serine/threonine-protein kinase [bacterium]